MGRLSRIPRKPSVARLLYAAVAAQIPVGVVMSETDVNNQLRAMYDDVATLRRALVDAGHLRRTVDGLSYQRPPGLCDRAEQSCPAKRDLKRRVVARLPIAVRSQGVLSPSPTSPARASTGPGVSRRWHLATRRISSSSPRPVGARAMGGLADATAQIVLAAERCSRSQLRR